MKRRGTLILINEMPNQGVRERIKVGKRWYRHVLSSTFQNAISPTNCSGDSFTLWSRNVFPVRYELDCKYCYK
jgi:hypothetical protein